MELEIKKGTFRGCVPVYSKTLTAEESTDAVVPDSKPDILRIADARCVAELSGKELRGGKVYLSGTVKCFVIYAPDGTSAPESLGVSLPFSVAADPGEDCRGAVIRARVMGASVLAREQNPRRINLRATVRLGLELWCSREISWCEDIANAGEYSVEMLSEELRTVAVGGFGEKMLSISESAELGEVRVTGAELMSWELRPAVNDVKLIPGKAVFKGNLDVRALLKTPSDGSATAQIALSVPFSGVTDCEGADPDGEAGIFVRCFDSELSLTEEPGTGRGLLGIKTNLSAEATSLCAASLSAVTDAYSTTHRLTPHFTTVPVCSQRRFGEIRADIRDTLNAGVGVRTVFSADGTVEDGEIAGGELCVTVRATVLFEGEDGGLYSVAKNVTARVPALENEGGSVVSLRVTGESYRIVSGDEIEFSATCEAVTEVCQSENKSLLAGAEVSPRELRGRAPSLTLCGMLKGETWWELGKRMSASVDDILSANGLSEGDSPGDKLLIIPKRAPGRSGDNNEGRIG